MAMTPENCPHGSCCRRCRGRRPEGLRTRKKKGSIAAPLLVVECRCFSKGGRVAGEETDSKRARGENGQGLQLWSEPPGTGSRTSDRVEGSRMA